MSYRNMQECLADLEAHGHLKRIDAEVDPCLELAAIQRRAFRANAPALLFTRVKGTSFPMLCNLFGTRERLHYIFRDSLPAVHAVLAAKADPAAALKNPWRSLAAVPGLWRMLPRTRRAGTGEGVPVLVRRCTPADLPRLTCWPMDGGAFITLPLVYTEDPEKPGTDASNLGMYRVQQSGNAYAPDEMGLHYQIHRGIGVHHAHALAAGRPLPVHVYVGGPPSLTVAAVMPLPEGLSELRFAGLLGGRRMDLARVDGLPLPVLAEADFCISGHVLPGLKPEGPFGDHVGYYSLTHDFPVFRVDAVYHREGAVWPFTAVGRPPQEDTVFGDFIHELTGPLVPQVFQGVREVHAVDAAGVHPLLLALGSERYTPYEAGRRPRELLTAALHLLGTTQTALAKYVLVAAHEDAPGLSARHAPEFLRHMLERADFSRDLHFITHSTNDTLDYTGLGLNEGSKLIWASAGEKRRTLGLELTGPAADMPSLPEGFGDVRLVGPGMLVVRGPAHALGRNQQDPGVEALAQALARWPGREAFPLVLVVDDADFCAENMDNFLWVAFTRSDPATDVYGARAQTRAKHWSCEAPLVMDARLKPFHAPPLEEDPAITRRVDALAAPGGPLHGYI
ncbi:MULTISPECIES: UbiD family decarboxylase [Desulfovibrio]|uniref:4-hydroxy-3-polyprenylbenzoate decarboxylase n=1 Tax=Desulfovibrio desulfuricans TaxID=876 RepID=A0AA94HSZ5_DESDE|nr:MULTISPECIES: UbiD family decarboxylase [Desulfovibrio]ATD81759.1 3-octaprenyl-4-hydroxybenzoate carboxy-lyase [Desulfovibrio sp. G11]SFW50112.1 4-hydroxy-3-polyprenylbenzoate decarboxylase [Desulfovibrio desulfuricans]SPD34487.1 UbiD decarboxylyase family [Desulfovibrio sp. G11]